MKTQLSENDCGAAVVRYLLMKLSSSKGYLTRGLKRRCDSLVSIKDELLSYGVVTEGVALINEKVASLKPYAIVRQEKDRHGHFLLFLRRVRRGLLFYDPARGKRVVKKSEIDDFKATSALTLIKSDCKKLPSIHPLRFSEHLLNVLLTVVESLSLISGIGFLYRRHSLTLIALSAFMMTIVVHLFYLTLIERRLSVRFVFPYLKKRLNYRDYEAVIAAKGSFIKVPQTIYSVIGAIGVLGYLLLLVSLPHFVSTLAASFCYLAIETIAERVIRAEKRRSAEAEQRFIEELKRKNLLVSRYNKSLSQARKVAFTVLGKYLIEVSVGFLFALAAAIVLKNSSLENILQLTITNLLFGRVLLRLAHEVRGLDCYYQQVSRLDPYAYEILTRDKKLAH